MKELEPSSWQRAAIDGLARRLQGRTSPRGALLQLPTGFGKSLVALKVFQKLKEKHPALKLLVVLQKQNVPAGWRRALGFGDEEDLPLFEPLRIRSVPGTVTFQTRLELRRALEPQRGWPPALAREIIATPHLVVVDEVHRHRRFLELFFQIFQIVDQQERILAETELSTPFRDPARGRRSWPKWLLLSATPINPVSLDTIDPPDTSKGNDTDDPEVDEVHDAEVLADALEVMHGALAGLSGLKNGPWFANYMEHARAVLLASDDTASIDAPRQLLVWPRNLRSHELRPRSKRRWETPPRTVSEKRLTNAIMQVTATAEAVDGAPRCAIRRRATAERLVLSGGLMKTKGASIQREAYSVPLARSVEAAVHRLRKIGVARPEKLDALVEFLASLGRENVLIFCVHRAVAASVCQTLKRSLGNGAVRPAVGNIDDTTIEWFNEIQHEEMRVIVATDACSESIDLHERANILVHYELPWSPLRVLQRVGRLWRLREREIREGKKPKCPLLPGVLHFAHPGSVDEEILSRLQRRWGYLKALGLDYLTYRQALGLRMPPVPW